MAWLPGLFNVATFRYLIAITGREEVAQLNGSPVYVISGVAVIPLHSQSAAEQAIKEARSSNAGPGSGQTDDEAYGDSGEEDARSEHRSTGTLEDEPGDATPASQDAEAAVRPPSTVAQDVVGKKGYYGRFTERWFSKNGWVPGRKDLQGAASSTLNAVNPFNRQSAQQNVSAETNTTTSSNGGTTSDVAVSLLPKLLHTLKMMLCSKSFYFSYDHDITRRLGAYQGQVRATPLYRLVDPMVWHRCSPNGLCLYLPRPVLLE